MISGLDLFLIGVLFSIREIIIYLFEIPSGVIADRYGKKVELIICFIFYIISFLIFFIANEFYLFAIAMILFAFGEAFRSGTHKSIIMAYLDIHQIRDSKTKVYGQTRAFSLTGSMIASLISIVFVLWLPEIRFLFLLAIIPYILDLLLIMSYPNYLNQRKDDVFSIKQFVRHNIESLKYAFSTKRVRNIILNASSYQAGFKSIKDYIQPILITISLSFVLFTSFTGDENVKIYIGVIYAVIYLISAISSKYAYKVKSFADSETLIRYMWLLTGSATIILSIFIDSIFVVFITFLLIYVFLNIRRPMMVERIGNATDPEKRASVLSIEAQITSLLVAVLAPLIGLLAEYSISFMFLLVGITMIVIFIFHSLFRHKLK